MGKKLKPKSGESVGITKIANLLREKETSTGKKTSKIKGEKEVPQGEGNFFQRFDEEIKNKEYNIKETLYVDEEIKEVLGLLKSKGKIQISSLVSFILEEWIFNNIEEVREVISREEKNRFL